MDRLSKIAQNELLNVVIIFLGLAVGAKLSTAQFLQLAMLGILALVRSRLINGKTAQ